MKRTLTQCPVCDHPLNVSELSCGSCHTKISGSFEACQFCQLPAEHAGFIEIFLRCEGNLSRVGEALELSYPTVRSRLTSALTALGFMEGGVTAPPPTPNVNDNTIRRQQILDNLAKGNIGADEAAIALSKL